MPNNINALQIVANRTPSSHFAPLSSGPVTRPAACSQPNGPTVSGGAVHSPCLTVEILSYHVDDADALAEQAFPIRLEGLKRALGHGVDRQGLKHLKVNGDVIGTGLDGLLE